MSRGRRLMNDLESKDESIRTLVSEVYQRVPRRLVDVVDTSPDDPYVISFVRARDAEEICTIRTQGNEPGEYDIIDEKMTVPRCNIKGVVWRINEGLEQKR